MHLKLLFLAFCTCSFSFSVFSQKQYTAIRYDPLSDATIAGFKFSVERSLGPHFSGALYIQRGIFTNKRLQSLPNLPDSVIRQLPKKTIYQDYRITGWGVIPEIRYYPFNKKPLPQGFLVGLYCGLTFLKEKYRGDPGRQGYTQSVQTKGFMLNPGISVGYKFFLGKHFFLEPLVGFALTHISWNTPNDRNRIPESYKNINHLPGFYRAELNLGIVISELKLPKKPTTPDSKTF